MRSGVLKEDRKWGIDFEKAPCIPGELEAVAEASCGSSLRGLLSHGGALLHKLGLTFPAWGQRQGEAGPCDLIIFLHRCQLSLGGHTLAIQTYAWNKSTYGNGKKYIATAYVVSSTR